MSQLIACQNAHGIILATDSVAAVFSPAGELRYEKVDRMLQLGPQAAILTGGAADGIHMCEALKSFVQEEGLKDIQEIYQAALSFLAVEFERFMRKRCEVIPLDPIHQLYFILGGHMAGDLDRPFRLYLLWTKRKLPRLDGDEIAVAFTAPRIMGLEYRLNQFCQANTPLPDILPGIRKAMEEQSQKNEEIGPPFSFGFITKEGFERA